ncbi:chitin synthase [Malassezia equina]|uniref:chitin synthase n=1 Tax=Malassezia equina TaxID=1381935 RepID=A0AAF0EFE3_9BASI|nr:chitin synthase [Malassezia equina]
MTNEGRSSGLFRGSSFNRGRDIESGADSGLGRKKSLVRPERARADPTHRQWHYRMHAAQMDQNQNSKVMYMPSTTGHMPRHGGGDGGDMSQFQGPGNGVSGYGVTGPHAPPLQTGRHPQLRRGKSFLGQNEDKVESGIHFLRRGVSMRKTAPGNPDMAVAEDKQPPPKEGCMDWIAPGPVGPWMIYSWFVTCCCTSGCLKLIGIKTPEQQRAWREKMGLISIILVLMAIVGYITFGFTQTVCGVQNRYDLGVVYQSKEDTAAVLVGGKMMTLDSWIHPPFRGIENYGSLKDHSPTYDWTFSAGSGANLNLIFPVTGGTCEGILNVVPNSNPPRYADCAIMPTKLPPYSKPFNDPVICHPPSIRQKFLSGGVPNAPAQGDAYVRWQDMKNKTNQLMFWRSRVVDLAVLDHIQPAQIQSDFIKQLKNDPGFRDQWRYGDITMQGMRSGHTRDLDCLAMIGNIGSVDVQSYGCIASQVELVLSMIFIVGAVAIKFLMAVFFAWFLSWRIGNYDNESYAQRMKRMNEIEDWSVDIYRPAPAGYRPNVKKSFLPKTSRFGNQYQKPLPKPTTMERKIAAARMGNGSSIHSPPGSPMLSAGRSSASLQPMLPTSQSARSSSSSNNSPWGPCPFPLYDVVPQPPSSYQPFNFPLVHSICLVTAYSESFEGLRTTLDSLATTNYPNSHKLLLVISDGIVKGADSDISTPDICLSMMKDLLIPPEEVEGYSYVAIADGTKRHNMAKVYAGFYDYDDQTVERSKQQRVPMILIAKCGTMMEMDSAKPGNRGKRDSQVMLMAFMQKVLFDERMTQFEYEFFNSIWRVTGVTADQYEIVLMVDADTKVFPDSLTRMTAAMVEDPEIMGLCGETKIANKAQSWVTMIQVFEYYISHHQTKGFEACFGGVTCLPGCFSAYRLKAPKGPKGFYVPILANPDIVEHYSENVVDTLHKKNLLLLGEDRYLTTLMLKTFPKRKMMFQPAAVCKTIVPDSFRVLRSQRRRWINSTVHNLFELIQVRDLCGTFCFSMRFVVFMDLVGTLVLPAALAFTLYVVARAIQIPIANKNKPPGQGEEFPTIPLVLLALVLGLPGVLIVITSRRFMYVIWMLVYLISLPVWNLILPSYAFWHMDDFSWGATRVVQGEKKGESHGDAEGEFDASDITMKRWIEYERERRWRSGNESRDTPSDPDSAFGPSKSGLEEQGPASASTTMTPEVPMPRGRMDSVPLLELPAPLGQRQATGGASSPMAVGFARPPPGPTPAGGRPLSPTSTGSAGFAPMGLRPPHPPSTMGRPPSGGPLAPGRVPAPLGSSPMPTSDPQASAMARQHLFGATPTSVARPSMPMRPPGAMSPPTSPPPSQPMAPNPWASVSPRPRMPTSAMQSGPGTMRPVSPATSPKAVPSNVERVSLVDDGPVTHSGAVRQVVRGARRQSQMGGPPSSNPFASGQS